MCGVSWLTQAVRPILCKHRSLATWDTVSQASKTLDESIRIQRIINYILGRHCTAGPSGPVTLNVQFSVVQELSPFNHLGRTWLHYMKASPLHISNGEFSTNEGQIDLYGSQLASPMLSDNTRSRANQEDASPLNQPCT
ncbi:hypothetical protein CK203_059540 [Vitis vinifera]|uniref:Uncharacterized protein n=1 Tax=Vitis vinifera TaxID=29760 RepID=A0A438FRM9_VITVI|nr:hypothetical protein CK203_059540 [Vitis vinifera]